MDEEQLTQEVNHQARSSLHLNWIDCLMAIAGIGVTFVLSNVVTLQFYNYFPDPSMVLYFNAFVTQLLLLFIVLLIKKSRKWSWADLGVRSLKMSKLWGKIIGLYALSLLINFIYIIYILSLGYTPPETDEYSQLLSQSHILLIILNIVLVGLIAPVIEEVLFRGVLYQGLLSHFGPWTSALLSGAFFAGIHFQAYGFIPRFALALMLVYLFKKYNSLYPAIALHAVNNLIAVILSSLLV